jgi:hypothetical protein
MAKDRTVRQIASERSYRNRHSETHMGVLGDPERIDKEGVIGELAFAREFFIPKDEIVRDHKVAYNFLLADGTRVDVRSSSHRDASLLVPPAVVARDTIDVYVLAEINSTGKDAKLVGWATRKKVMEAPKRKVGERAGATVVHYLRPYDLEDMDELKARHVPRTKGLW